MFEFPKTDLAIYCSTRNNCVVKVLDTKSYSDFPLALTTCNSVEKVFAHLTWKRNGSFLAMGTSDLDLIHVLTDAQVKAYECFLSQISLGSNVPAVDLTRYGIYYFQNTDRYIVVDPKDIKQLDTYHCWKDMRVAPLPPLGFKFKIVHQQCSIQPNPKGYYYWKIGSSMTKWEWNRNVNPFPAAGIEEGFLYAFPEDEDVPGVKDPWKDTDLYRLGCTTNYVRII